MACTVLDDVRRGKVAGVSGVAFFYLECSVIYAEMFSKFLTRSLNKRIVSAPVWPDQISRNGNFGCAQWPDMKIMNFLHPGHPGKQRLDLRRIEILGYFVQRQIDTVTQQNPRGDENQRGDSEAHDRVEP